MPSDTDQVFAFLNNIHLFHSYHLTEQQLIELAGLFTKTNLAENEVLYHQGDHADSFYIIMEGQVQVSRNAGRNEKKTTKLSTGDFFGEEPWMGSSHRHNMTAAETDCILLSISRDQFKVLLQRVPDFKTKIHATVANRKLAGKKRWTWMSPDEIVYVLLRKHSYFLFSGLTVPLTLLAFGLFISIYLFFYVPFLKGLFMVEAIGGAWCVGSLLWLGWRIWDWSNDYCFVTNLRVIWLEKVAGIYESRQEAPIQTILSVGVVSDQIGRMVGFGDVVVRTYTGSILLSRIKDPMIVASIIEEQLRRSRGVIVKEEASEMERAIRSSLINSPNNDQPTTKTETIQKPVASTVKPGFIKQFLAYLFQVRIDTGDVVTYRKHWFVLVGATWKQIILFGLVIVALVGRIHEVSTFLSSDIALILAGFSLTIIFLWWLYDVIDWHNDIYQVTADQIIDIDRKPFGSEKKKTAPLENILSIGYERLGILGLLFNYGTVNIKIGNTTFDFKYVFNPSRVQQDIFRRKLAKEALQKKSERDAERERLSSWIATYHRYSEQLSSGGQQPPNKPLSQDEPPLPASSEENHEDDGQDRDGFGWIE